MGCPIPPYFAVSTSLLLSGAYLLRDSLCYGRSAVIKTKSRYFCNFFAISSSLSPHAKQESDVSWQITCAIGGMNIDVALWAKWHGCGAGRSELGCSAGWTLGWVYGAATWNDAAPQVDIWNSAMFEFARSACLPISRTFRRVCDFQRGLRQPIASRIPLVASICPLRVISTASRLGCPSA